MRAVRAKALKRFVYGVASSKPEDRRYLVQRPEGKFWYVPMKSDFTKVYPLQKLQIQADPLRQAYQHAKRRYRHVPISSLPKNSPILS